MRSKNDCMQSKNDCMRPPSLRCEPLRFTPLSVVANCNACLELHSIYLTVKWSFYRTYPLAHFPFTLGGKANVIKCGPNRNISGCKIITAGYFRLLYFPQVFAIGHAVVVDSLR